LKEQNKDKNNASPKKESVVAVYKEFLILLYFQALSQKTSTAVDFYADARFFNPKNQKFLGTPLCKITSFLSVWFSLQTKSAN